MTSLPSKNSQQQTNGNQETDLHRQTGQVPVSKKIKLPIPPTIANQKTQSKPSSRLREALALLDQIPADEYKVWFRVGCALKHLGASYEFFRKWSATSEKFDEDECRKQWDTLPEDE